MFNKTIMNVRFIKSPEKREIVKELNSQFGITSLPYLLLQTGKEKIRGFSGSMTKEEIIQLSKLTNIEIIGLYMFKKEHDYRLTIDAAHLLKDQINKNILEITDEQLHEWLRGRDLEIIYPQATIIIRNKSDFIGCGRSNEKKIFNYIPKDRRLRK